MNLSPSSSVIIDLLLLADAAIAEDKTEVRRLARRVQRMAESSGSHLIAKHARDVELLAARDAAAPVLEEAVDRLLADSEREIHAVGIWANEDAADLGRRSA